MARFWLAIAFVAAALVAGGVRAVAQDGDPAATPAAEPAIVVAYAEALNAHEPERVAALYAEDATVEQAVRDGNLFRGRAEIAAWVADNLRGVPDLTVTTESAIVEGDRIAWQWVYRGAYTGQYPGLPAGEGQPIELRGVSLLTLEDGLIARETVYFDNASFLAQVGALPRSGAAAGTPTS
jgi:steroid delta-isomerase-like uncharacterized protein